MMTVYVRLFARAKDLAGTDCLTVELGDKATVKQLRRRLASERPALETILSRSAFAVNEEFAGDDQVLKPGATVAVLPPVSGGQ